MRVFVSALLVVSIGGPAMAYEEPRYEVVREYADFEVRRYEPQLVAETEVTGDFEDVGNEAFRILAGYIFGANRSSEKIAMTAPVTQEESAKGEKIAMTAPVTQQADPAGSANTYVFRFVMPSKYTRETLPVPTDPRVRIRELPPKQFAALRFSGTWGRERYARHEAKLLAALEREGLTPTAPPVFARYNSPFTLWFLRRNEVLIEIGDGPQLSAPSP